MYDSHGRVYEYTVILAVWQSTEPEVPAEESGEPAVEEPTAEASPAEEEIPAEEIPAEEAIAEEPTAEQPAANYTVSFDGGGGDGAMEAVQVTGSSEYTLPNPGYTIEGATFDCWEISGNGEAEPFVINAGETLIVGGDMTATAMWAFSEEGEALEAVDMPSEVGSVFNGAGVAAIVAAVAMVLVAAGIAVILKKKK